MRNDRSWDFQSYVLVIEAPSHTFHELLSLLVRLAIFAIVLLLCPHDNLMPERTSFSKYMSSLNSDRYKECLLLKPY